ncbi:hypothetical protein FB45DRAFT_864691 [Roridomyces roridus]|uniref:Uncharacterized protein n=1 Tax=Roridomyces roridus TaxID=1738132 RepID=A0AAD7C1M4_9AGAR|nr:hypothetical protein FB45DRAFT_864691 [Roridomyces roridus]
MPPSHRHSLFSHPLPPLAIRLRSTSNAAHLRHPRVFSCQEANPLGLTVDVALGWGQSEDSEEVFASRFQLQNPATDWTGQHPHAGCYSPFFPDLSAVASHPPLTCRSRDSRRHCGYASYTMPLAPFASFVSPSQQPEPYPTTISSTLSPSLGCCHHRPNRGLTIRARLTLASPPLASLVYSLLWTKQPCSHPTAAAPLPSLGDWIVLVHEPKGDNSPTCTLASLRASSRGSLMSVDTRVRACRIVFFVSVRQFIATLSLSHVLLSK